MAQIEANGIKLEYDDFGDPAAPPILLVMGLGAQMTLWPMELVDALVEHGFRVIRYDNRDIGLSHKFEGAKAPGIVRLMLSARFGLKPRVPYTLADMADDGIGLLDALGIDRAHVVGASMGGMIAQHMAFSHPDRVISLTSVMSTTGNRKLPPAKREAISVLTKRPASMDWFLETLQMTEEEFYKYLEPHQVHPWKFDRKNLETGPVMPDFDKWDLPVALSAVARESLRPACAGPCFLP